MKHAHHSPHGQESCEIVDFGEALLEACPPEEREDLMTEARILAQAFGDGAVEELERMAEDLSTGARDDEMGGPHARKLAAALRRLAEAPWT